MVSNSTNISIYFFHVRFKYVAIFVCAVVCFLYIVRLDLASAKNGATFQLLNRCFEILNVNKDLVCQSVLCFLLSVGLIFHSNNI